MADMVDVEETDEEMDRLKGELEDAKVKSDTVPILQQALKEMTTERDDLRKLLREVEAAIGGDDREQGVCRVDQGEEQPFSQVSSRRLSIKNEKE